MNTPCVSVVMPVYNVENYVAAAIRSVLKQTYSDFELLIIDDGGQDGSVEICRGFSDPRIRIISQFNRGLAGARNTGIRHAQGEIIAFLDSDDVWHPKKLELHVNHLKRNPWVGVSYSGSVLIDEVGRDTGLKQSPRLHDIEAPHVFLRNPIGNGSAPVIRKAALDEIARPMGRPGELGWFTEALRQSEDIDCWLRIALTTQWTFEGLKGHMTGYRVNSGGLSANILNQFKSWTSVRNTVRELDPEFAHKWEGLAEAFQRRYLARRAVRMRQSKLALEMVLGAIQCAPSIMIREPKKTLTTLGAAILMTVLPSQTYETLETRVLNQIKSQPAT